MVAVNTCTNLFIFKHMNLEVLISCMHQQDASIIRRTNVQSDVLVINQCDVDKQEEFEFCNKKGEKCRARIIYTTERGLSRSRNMAISNAVGDICLICDNDEILDDAYVDNIVRSYKCNLKASVIVFQIHNRRNNRRGSARSRRLFWLSALHVFSPQITFKRDDILRKNIVFDESLGAGVSKAGGEENLFLYDCLRKRLVLWTEPIYIASLIPNFPSTWFYGYNKEYLIDRGSATKKTVGLLGSIVYNLVWCLKNRALLELPVVVSFKYILSGILKR